ncbi:MAG: hypothetical protein QGH39_07660, partial [Candidatus Thermoplasmatota archaeon]|nr:hypothetical protein [Candidatus Thermoplasmatota archaeon]
VLLHPNRISDSMSGNVVSEDSAEFSDSARTLKLESLHFRVVPPVYRSTRQDQRLSSNHAGGKGENEY